MAVYEFKGVNQKGQNVSGRVEADNVTSARSQVKNNGIYIVSIKDQSQQGNIQFLFAKKVDIKTLNLMTHNLATMLKSGVPLVDAYDTLIKQSSHPTMKEALTQIRNSINEGKSMHRALAMFPKIFNTTYISMCEAGELSGNLDVVLKRLAQFTEAQSRLQDKVRSALIYPSLMAVFAFFMIIFLLVYVVPKVRVLFEESTASTLPWYSTMLLNFSDYLIANWIPLSLFSALIIFGIWRWKKSPRGQKAWDHISLKIPVFGPLIRSVAISRFSRTLSTLLRGGVPVMDALDIVKNVVNNQKLQKVITETRELISRGENLSTPLIHSGEFPPMVTQMIRVGEKTGHLEEMLSQISDTYDNQVRTDLEAMTALLEPAMLILMGGVIAFIVFSTIIPLLQIYNLEGLTGSIYLIQALV